MRTCAECAWLRREPKEHRITSFTLEGVKHHLPDIWIAGSARTLGSVENALHQWSYQCELAALSKPA